MPPIFVSTILQSVRKENLAHYFSYDVKLRLLAHSRSFLAYQKARNAIVGAENLLKFNNLFSVHVVQSVIQWGKNPVVVIKQQDDHVKSVKKSKPQNAKDGSTKRQSRQDAKDDRLLIKKLKEDDAMAVRSDRQQSELRALNAGTIS